MNTEECCNHNCNQGRDCPLRKKDETLDTRSYLIGRYDAIKTDNKPVAWIAIGDNTSVFFDLDCALSIDDNPTPLYTHPHPDNLGLAESIVKQQELRIAELEAKIDEMAGEIMSLENRIGTMTGYGHN